MLIRKSNILIGEQNINTNGTVMKIVNVVSSDNITVEFQDEFKIRKKTTYSNFERGLVKNPYDKTVYGVGYLGYGKHKASCYKDGRITNSKEYKIWTVLIERCYTKEWKERHPEYKDCIVCKEWHNFQNFAEWYKNNYYIVDNERMDLDKDILIKGNKIYSPNTCMIVPHRINLLFINRRNYRGVYPLGVQKQGYKFTASCVDKNSKPINKIGLFDSPEEAFCKYKENRERVIKEVADDYKDKIPKKLYDALYSYKIDITD